MEVRIICSLCDEEAIKKELKKLIYEGGNITVRRYYDTQDIIHPSIKCPKCNAEIKKSKKEPEPRTFFHSRFIATDKILFYTGYDLKDKAVNKEQLTFKFPILGDEFEEIGKEQFEECWNLAIDRRKEISV